jgi:hypothetical protein
MDIPDGAKVPTDHRPQVSQLAAEASHPRGWDLLLPWHEVEFEDKAELVALLASVDTDERDQVALTSKSISVVGKLGTLLTRRLSRNPAEFKAWLTAGEFNDQLDRVIALAFPYANQLGEANSSAR